MSYSNLQIFTVELIGTFILVVFATGSIVYDAEFFDGNLGIPFAAVAPFIALVVSVVGKHFRRYSRRIQASMGDVTQVSSESINAYLAEHPPGDFTVVTLGRRELEVPVGVS